MLWIMDASINVSMEPFRALLAIIFRKTTYHGICHAKFFYWDWRLITVNFTYLGVDNTALWYYSDSVKYFYFGGIAFIVTVLVSLLKKYSRRISRFEKHKETSLIKETHSAGLHLMENLT
jgi:maltose/moltooligosaccharide transporter